MPPKRKKRGRHVHKRLEQDDTESESGKLSETQEVARRLSRARLDKENSSKIMNTPVPSQRESDSYDADSEPDGNNQPMITDQHLRSQSQRDHDRVPSFHSDHSTPSIPVVGDWSPLPYSPVGAPQLPLAFDTFQSSFSSVSSSVVSPRKRKPGDGFYDIPFTKPKKTKKKTKISSEQKTGQDELEEMRIHFMEIEKLELFVE